MNKSKIHPNSENEISIEKIRQAGICRHYEQLRDQGLSPKECLEKTASFARISVRQGKGILTRNIQPTGKKTSTFSEYLEEIEDIAAQINKAENQKVYQIYGAIRRKIKNDPNLNEEEKCALESEIVHRIQEVKGRIHTQNVSSKKPQVKSIAEFVKDYKTKDEVEHNSVDDLRKYYDLE